MDSISGGWRTLRYGGRDVPAYEMTPTQEVRRSLRGCATWPGRIIGYRKDGVPYPFLGIRVEGETHFASRDALARETYPELVKDSL